MAESAVSLVIDKLVPLLAQELTVLKDVHEEVAEIKDDLEDIRAFLKDADSQAEKDGISEGVKLWVEQASEVAYHMEDVIDRYMFHVARDGDRRGFIGFLHRISSFVKQLQLRCEVASEIRHIQKTIQKVRVRCEGFQFVSLGQRSSSSNARGIVLHDPRLHSISIDEANLVGIESPRDELISLLISGTSQRKVISIVGFGGVGKTTIARKVYDNHSVRRHFGCHAWITVSRSYDRRQMLRSILQKFSEEKNEVFPQSIVMMDEPSLISKLREYLQVERYLVVFDDVWELGFWGDVEHALLNNNNGSRILFTSRNEDVANFCRSSSLVHVYRLKLLTQQEAWELFCKKAYKFEFEGKCPKELEELSHKIVKRCGGLPLALVAVGGLLATKEKAAAEWKKLLDSLGSALMGDPHLENVTKILSLSFGDLPHNLKSCFLFLGMFPEDFYISSKRLIQLWVAESFVQEKQGMMLEEVAEEYLIELIHRSLVEVDTVGVKGIPITFRVHDMVREVILSKSKELSFCHVSSNLSTFEGIARHLSITDKGSDNPKSSTKSQTRSIMVFTTLKLPKSLMCAMFGRCKLLMVLDFEGCPIDHIPNQLGKLIHLRYLNLRATKVSKLPKSIGKLHDLESLDLRDSLVEELPVEINRFPKLRHLLVDGLKIRGSIGHLEFLQILYRIRGDARLINELGMLKQLRGLGMGGLKRDEARDLCISLEKMTNLRSLFIFMEGEILEVQSISSPPLQLQTLLLSGQLESLPRWISKLSNLSKLRLYSSRLINDPMEVLQALPNLKYMFLTRYNGVQMHFESGGFQKLKFLCLAGLNDLNMMIIDKGAMPVLEQLYIGGCSQLKNVPSGIQHLRDLKELHFAGMLNEFTQRLSSDGGQDYWIVKHVPFLQYDGTYDPQDENSYGAFVLQYFG